MKAFMAGKCHCAAKTDRVYSVRDGAYLGYTDAIAAAIEPAVAQLYALLPAEVGEVRIEGLKKSHRCGEKAECKLRAQVRPDVVMPHVFHMEVRTPQGQAHRQAESAH
ncbi:MAG: hypothetical protein HY360_18110 [Verrucomicrobia bacterium]|nr:hypothetical protein [Verrucomicrobiota bacterium]